MVEGNLSQQVYVGVSVKKCLHIQICLHEMQKIT